MSSLLDEEADRATRERLNPRLADERWERTHPPREEPGHRAFTASEIAGLQARRSAGWKVTAIAALYGVHRRTIYRYLDGEIVNVKAGDCVAPFRLRKGRDPVRVGPWEPAA